MGPSSIIYLDNSATTRVRTEVLAAMAPFQSDCWGNASSSHGVGRQCRRGIEQAREQVAALIGANAAEIFFTPCATYSNNVALLGRARYVEENGLGRHIITSSIEHSSVLGPVKHLQSKGWKVTTLGVDAQGFIDLDELRQVIGPQTSIISIMWGNNEIGTLQPIEQVAAMAAERGIFFHTDAVQVAGKVQIDVSSTAIDALSLSGHKFHGPKGIGVLYIREGVQVLPLVFGGGQECGLFPGTENVAHIVGLGKAAELAAADLKSDEQRIKLARIQELLIAKLSQHSSVRLTGAFDLSRRVPGHVSITVDGAVGADLCDDAYEQGLCVSSVSACSSNGGHPSHVLKAVGLSEEQTLGSVRISAGWFNSEEECDRAADILNCIVAQHSPQPQPAQQPLVSRHLPPVTAPAATMDFTPPPSAPSEPTPALLSQSQSTPVASAPAAPSTSDRAPSAMASRPDLHLLINHIAHRRIDRHRYAARSSVL